MIMLLQGSPILGMACSPGYGYFSTVPCKGAAALYVAPCKLLKSLTLSVQDHRLNAFAIHLMMPPAGLSQQEYMCVD